MGTIKLTDEQKKARARRRGKSERERDDLLIANMYLQGKPQRTIALEVGVGLSTVCNSLKKIQAEWEEAAKEAIGKKKARELAKIDHLENVYFEAWEQSKQEKQIKLAEKHENTGQQGQQGRGGNSTKTSIRKEERDGNPTYLSGVQWCIEQRCKILGLFAPVKQEQVGPTVVHVKYDMTRGGVVPADVASDEIK
jgi:hypothetical protein